MTSPAAVNESDDGFVGWSDDRMDPAEPKHRLQLINAGQRKEKYSFFYPIFGS